MKRKTNRNQSYFGLLILGVILIVSVSLFSMGMGASNPCQVWGFSNEAVAAYRGISLEVVSKLRSERSLTNPEICQMPQEKLERAIFRVDNPKPDHPGEAALFRAMQNQDENGEIPADALGKALAHVDEMPRIDLTAEWESANPGRNLNPNDWSWLGPGNIGGRVRSIVVHPTEPDRMWAGAVSGGIWVTSNAGASWSPVDDFLINLAVSSLILDPTDPDTLYAGTGEGFYNADAVRGAGVFKSTDGGVSWSQLPSTATSDWYWVNRLAISPNGDTLLAATRSGIWRSLNAGNSWTRVNTDTNVKDVDFHPSENAKAVAGSVYCSAYYSSNGGETWTPASGFSACEASSSYLTRIELAYAPSSPDLVYASVNQNSGEVWGSTNGGQTFSLISTGYSYLGGQGWYDNIIWVDPSDANTVIVGGIDLWRSSSGGLTFTKISQWWNAPTSAHADQHAIVAHPDFDGTSNKTVFFGNDGGVYKTDNVYTVGIGFPVTGWVELNNQLGITQFYGGAGSATSGLIIGGTQDNGTLRYSGDSEAWTFMNGGDGGFCASDPTDPDYFYGEYVYLTIHRSTNGGLSASNIYAGITDAWDSSKSNFIAPFILDPNDPDIMLAGGVSLWRSTNVKANPPSWEAVKPSVGSKISAIGVAPGDSDIIWVGHNNGEVYFTENGTDTVPTWTRVDQTAPELPDLPDRYVHRITVDPWDHQVVYVTFGGFSADNVYKTIDSGTHWTDITGSGSSGLPEVPVRSLVVHPDMSNQLFIATEVGVFVSMDGGENWGIPQDGPANVAVDELFWMDHVLVAATHGRGMYQINLDRSTVYLPLVLTNNDP